jgi:hypothetical protein
VRRRRAARSRASGATASSSSSRARRWPSASATSSRATAAGRGILRRRGAPLRVSRRTTASSSTSPTTRSTRRATPCIASASSRAAAARPAGGTPALADAGARRRVGFRAAILDDLNAPEALGALFTFLKRANAELGPRGRRRGRARRGAPRVRGHRLGARSRPRPHGNDAGPHGRGSRTACSARKDARARRDFAAADAIRGELDARGSRSRTPRRAPSGRRCGDSRPR